MLCRKASPAIGIGYRASIDQWTRENLEFFDVLEITVDHCINSSKSIELRIFDLVGRIPLTAHGIGLSIGTDTPLDLAYLDKLQPSLSVSERPPIANTLPSPARLAEISLTFCLCQKRRPWPKRLLQRFGRFSPGSPFRFYSRTSAICSIGRISNLSDAEFLNLICRETGAGLLLDVENLFLNAKNHDFDPYTFLDALPADLVKEVHVAGGMTIPKELLDCPFHADSHSHPVPDGALKLLDHVLARHAPETIVLERDDRLHAVDEILDDIGRIRSVVARQKSENPYVH